MASYKFNGTTAAWTPAGGQAADLEPLRSVSTTNEAAEIRVTGAGDSAHTYEAGIPKRSTTVTIVGDEPATLVHGGKGALAISWTPGGTVGSLTNGEVKSITHNGAVDGEKTTTIVFVDSLA